MSSNRNGRALEYCLTKILIEAYQVTAISENTQADQQRDQAKFEALPANMQSYYQKQCLRFVQWLQQTKFPKVVFTAIERLNDNAAKKGDVTDIRLTHAQGTYNISLKHNHYAVKHQRPGALYKQLGIKDKTAQREYKKQLKQVETTFFQLAQSIDSEATTFKAIKEKDANAIKALYADVCRLVEDHINHQTNSDHAQYFFRFLVGTMDFDKVIITEDSIKILSFQQVPLPTHIAAHHYDYNRIKVEFDNGFDFDMRIHTASSRFQVGKSISLKFDTQLSSDNVPEIIL